MIPLHLPGQVLEMDRRAFERGVDPAELMDRAAAHLARGVLAVGDVVAGRRHGLRVVLVCGKGGNGGDGIAAARHLAARGVHPTAVLIAPPAELGPDASREHAGWTARRGRVRVATDRAALDAALAGADVVVDCVLGTGSSGEPRGAAADAVAAIAAARARGVAVVACDLPSGVDAATGRVPGPAVTADLTVVLGAHKRGLWLPPASEHVGALVLGELDVVDGASAPVASVLEAADLPALLPPAGRRAHKRSRGVVLVYAGAAGTAGAAVLCARGALAAGAGLVTVATSAAAAAAVAAHVPEAMTLVLPDDADGIVQAVTAQVGRSDVLAVGPGLGLAPHTQAAVRRLVADVELPVVLDADGLNAFRDHVDALPDHASRLLAMTPHAQELGRLTGTSGHGVHARRADLAAEQAAAWRATVVAKGPGTVVAAPDGRVWINATGGPALATGGTGDVLTGVVATALAQRADPSAVAAAVHLHGLAGDLAAAARGVRATTAGDVADHLGAAALRLGI
jgi:ADP-dependent NAD(P)H-hydrate dehydratase / NAD(P)H-hydrate epimerase